VGSRLQGILGQHAKAKGRGVGNVRSADRFFGRVQKRFDPEDLCGRRGEKPPSLCTAKEVVCSMNKDLPVGGGVVRSPEKAGRLPGAGRGGLR
jgi:hypothetical protein